MTVGCIPITDQQIDELYILAAHARNQGQEYIPVHIFPVRFNVQKSVNYLNNLSKDDPSLKKFAARMEDAFDYFEKYKQLPVVMINDKGDYIVNNAPEKKVVEEVKPKKREPVAHRTREIASVAQSVHQWPQFEGGADGYTKYLDKLGKEIASKLPEGVKKSYVQVEFIVDKDGVSTNFKVLKGPNDEDFNDALINEMEKMPTWKPALLNDKPVAKKMVQTITVEAE